MAQILPPKPQFVEKQGWSYVSRTNQVRASGQELYAYLIATTHTTPATACYNLPLPLQSFLSLPLPFLKKASTMLYLYGLSFLP